MAMSTTLILCATFLTIVAADNPERGLVKDLLGKYEPADRIVRPIAEGFGIVLVKYGIALTSIQDFNEESQVLTANVWERYVWVDENLKWNHRSYGGIDHTRLPPAAIWRPDIVLYNSFNPAASAGPADDLAVVSSNGDVLWIPPKTYQVYCQKDTNGTFDCTFKFGSWTYDGFKVDLTFYDDLEDVDMSDFREHHKWEVVRHSATRHIKYYPCCEEPYIDLDFNIVISKK